MLKTSVWSEQHAFGFAGRIDETEVIVEGRAGVDAELVVEHVVNVEHHLLCLRPGAHAGQIAARC